MKKFLKKAAIVIGVLFIVIQFYRPEKSNPPVDESKVIFATMKVPENIQLILKRSCFDCHSNSTVWPWYSNVAPASWLVIRDANEGRKHLNFSRWGEYSPSKSASLFNEIYEEVEAGRMPFAPYLIMHSDAKLSPEDIQAMLDWAADEQDRIMEGNGGG